MNRLSEFETVHAAMTKIAESGPFEIELRTEGDCIHFEHSPLPVPSHWMAEAIVAAVRCFQAAPTTYKGRPHTLSLTGEKVFFDQVVRFDWARLTIETSFRPAQESLFLEIMSYFVNYFRSMGTPIIDKREVN